MYTPLYFSQIMDVNRLPFKNRWTETIKKTLEDPDGVLSFLWYDEHLLNPAYHGPHKCVNDVLLSNRSQMYKAMTGKEAIPQDKKQDKALAAEAFSSFILVNKWAQNKQVYKFDPELELTLADCEEVKLPVRILDRLPYNTFYIEFADNGIFRSNFHGAFVHIVKENLGYLVYIERVTEDGKAMFGNVPLVPDKADGIFYFSRNEIAASSEAGRNIDWQEFGFFLLNALLYLCADNREVKESEVTKSTYRPGKTVKNKFSEVRQWECGYRYGSSVRTRKEKPEAGKIEHTERSTQGTKRKVMAAHTRRAHWHHYWTGPRDGKRVLILHWIAPTFVSGQAENAAVVHRVS